MKAYPVYKDSGVEWIGEIPKHWKLKRLKFIASINPSSKESKNSSADSLVPFLPMENLTEKGDLNFEIMKPLAELQNGFTYFEENDVIVAKITPCFENGKAALIKELNGGYGFGSTEFHVMRANRSNLDNKFLFFIIKSHSFRSMGKALMTGAAGQKRVPTSFVKEYQLVLPPPPEQQAIANYLDDKTRKIDTLIEKKQRLIALLKEQRTAIINHAVTKGINPKAKMKDSGIEWLGEIPEPWEVKKLKYVSVIQNSNVDKKNYDNEKKVLLCNYLDVYKNEFIDTSIPFMEASASEGEISKFKIKRGDVLVTKDSETPEDIAVPALVISDFENVICGYHLAQIRQNGEVFLGEYLLRLFQSKRFNGQFEVGANGVTRFGLSVSAFTDAFIPLPSIEEQKKITQSIMESAKHIDTEGYPIQQRNRTSPRIPHSLNIRGRHRQS